VFEVQFGLESCGCSAAARRRALRSARNSMGSAEGHRRGGVVRLGGFWAAGARGAGWSGRPRSTGAGGLPGQALCTGPILSIRAATFATTVSRAGGSFMAATTREGPAGISAMACGAGSQGRQAACRPTRSPTQRHQRGAAEKASSRSSYPPFDRDRRAVRRIPGRHPAHAEALNVYRSKVTQAGRLVQPSQ
jgi:hypothetical protein